MPRRAQGRGGELRDGGTTNADRDDTETPPTHTATAATPQKSHHHRKVLPSTSAIPGGRRDASVPGVKKLKPLKRGDIVWARVSVDGVVAQIAKTASARFLESETVDAETEQGSDERSNDRQIASSLARMTAQTPVSRPHYNWRPCIVSHQEGHTLFLYVLASFRGNPIQTVNGLAQFFCVPVGQVSHDEAVLSGRPCLETKPPWTHPDGRACYALAFPVQIRSKEVSRQQRCAISEGLNEFCVWAQDRIDDLARLQHGGGRTLLVSFLGDEMNPAHTPGADAAPGWDNTAQSARSWIESVPLSWVASSLSSYSYAPSLLSSLGLNPNATEFRPSNSTKTSFTGPLRDALSSHAASGDDRSSIVLAVLAGADLKDAEREKFGARQEKENIPPNHTSISR